VAEESTEVDEPPAGQSPAAVPDRPRPVAPEPPAAVPEPTPPAAVPEPTPPAAVPEPTPSAAPDGPPELATVAACWPAVIDIVRQANQLLGALLVDARPVSLEGSEVTLAFPKSKAFAQRKAQQEDYRRATAEALRSVIGTPLNLRYELRDVAVPEDEPGGQAAAEAGLSQEELVRRLVEEFDAKEVLDDPDQET
jgi:DNA polymerase III subunit gamma/tau